MTTGCELLAAAVAVAVAASAGSPSRSPGASKAEPRILCRHQQVLTNQLSGNLQKKT